MNCRGVSRRLSAYIDNELSPGIRQSVEDHLQSCAVCKRKLSEFRAISDAARSLPPLGVSEGFKDRVLDSVKAQDEKAIAFYGFRLRAALAGMAFVGAATAVFFISGPEPSNSPSAILSPNAAVKNDGSADRDSGTLDFTADPKIKIESFPVPEGAKALDRLEDSLLLADSSSKIDEFVLPVIEKTKENVNIKF